MPGINMKEQIEDCVKTALKEDIGKGDVSAQLLPADTWVTADIISREPMLVCGQPWVNAAFKLLDNSIQLDWLVKEGQWLDCAQTLCTISGPVMPIVSAERTALNFLQTLSATATQAHAYVLALKNTKTRLLDTRKTLPGLRIAQKYAVACAGGINHRMGLFDAYLIKENHIKACGSITKAIKTARSINKQLLLVIEVETLEELKEALEAKPDRILLDNFTQDMLKKAVAMNQSYRCELEASGGIDLTNIEAIAKTGVDFISVGAMTKSLKAIDLSLLIRA
jgi:nicotinate-nucleotide pyrophosphorylase (carboxylating)